MARPISHPTISYRLLSWLLFPAALFYSGVLAFKHRDFSYLLQRLGQYDTNQTRSSVIWCHCASFGEVNTALPLLKELANRGEYLLVTTNTVTGKQALAKAQLKNAQHAFLPLDYGCFAGNLIRTFTPRICFIFETELWPSLLLTVNRQNIPHVIVNGRISHKTLHAPSLVLKNYKRVLQGTHKILASSEENAARFIALGARPETVTILDNLKFANLSKSPETEKPCGINPPFLLCASTHKGEEQLIISAWKQHKPENLSLVIAIRHPERSKEVSALLDNSCLDYCLHSNNPDNIPEDAIYIIDTLGQLLPFMSQADFVFMGGSLVPIGGHNIIEPAQYGRCILIGPHYHDFKDIVDDMLRHHGITVIQNAEQLMYEVHQLNSHPDTKHRLGMNAEHYLQSKNTVLPSYRDIIFQLLKDYS